MSEPDFASALVMSFWQILPEIVLVVVSCVAFLGGLFRQQRQLWAGVSLGGIVLAGLAWRWIATTPPAPAPETQVLLLVSPVRMDGLAWFIRLLTLAVGAILVLFSWDEVGDRQAGDYYGCLLIVLAGLSLTGAANELVTLFLALELISIPTYIMLYLPKEDEAAQEAALKYFLLSIFSSAILLFGFSYLYGLAGSTHLGVIQHTLCNLHEAREIPVLAQAAMILVVAGLGFKITAVPFHFYAPDVYQGTATVLAGLLAVVPKIAGFAAMLRVLGFILPLEFAPLHRGSMIGTVLSEQVPILMWFLAAITMFLGNLLALLQDNLRRLLAYSSIAHAGYMLIAVASAPLLPHPGSETIGGAAVSGVQVLLFYLVAYGAMTIGAFAVLAYVDSPERPIETVDDLVGLGQTRPGLSLLLVIFLFSLIGIPLTAGFTGKLLIFYGALGVTTPGYATLFRVLALIGVINAAIGAWYYLKLMAVMYLRQAIAAKRPVLQRNSLPKLAAIVICAILTVGLSIPPAANWLLQLGGLAAQSQLVPAGQATTPSTQLLARS